MEKPTLPSPIEIEIARLLIECILELLVEDKKLKIQIETVKTSQVIDGSNLGEVKI